MVKADVRVNGKEVAEYPKLMISREDGAIVLFMGHEEGVCLRAGRDEDIGEYSEVWDMSAFSDFDGSITLSNEG